MLYIFNGGQSFFYQKARIYVHILSLDSVTPLGMTSIRVDFCWRSTSLRPENASIEGKRVYPVITLGIIAGCQKLFSLSIELVWLLNIIELGFPNRGKSFIYQNVGIWIHILSVDDVTPLGMRAENVLGRPLNLKPLTVCWHRNGDIGY